MIKAKFGGDVKAKTPTAQVNEVLAKIVCHNISAVIRAYYELGVAPSFDLAAPRLRGAASGIWAEAA